jgi:lipopolysaccharide/colanic/teichoic acid biosynthesis glycosyltransferase
MKRIFDFIFSLVLIVVLSPLLLVFALAVVLDSKGGAFFGQIRVGKDGKHFKLWKFRTMRPNSESSGQITVGARDNRITRVGYYLRKYKMDELPQLWNVLVGDMSVVGPRPEVPKYVALYNTEQMRVLSVRPGITDYASLEYFEESELLAKATDPHKTYVEEIMQKKLALNLQYVESHSFLGDLKIILKTALRIVS